MKWLAAGTMRKGKDVSEHSHGAGTGIPVFPSVGEMEL